MNDILSDTTIGGDASNATTWNGGTVQSGVGLFVSAGGIASNVSAGSGGYIDVYNSGSAVRTYLFGGDSGDNIAATLNVLSGGQASFTSAVDGANILVSGGGTTSGDIAGTGGQETVWGSAVDLTVDGGHAYLSHGGNGTNWTAANGGWIGIYSGGTLTGLTVSGAHTYADIFGGQVSNASATEGGIVQIENGVTVSVVRATSGGDIQVSAGGIAQSAVIEANGVMDVQAGGSSLSATLEAEDATLNLSGGKASQTNLSAGAVNVYTGGDLTDTTVQSGVINLSGGRATVVSATNGSGGINVFDGGQLTSASLQSGGYVHISAGGTALSDIVQSGGTEYVDDGGTSISAQILTSNANIIVSAGGLASDAKIISGYGTVYDSGTMNGGSIQSGIITVSGGVVSGMVADNGGGFDVSGGSVSALNINTGGFINLYENGSATNVTGSGSNLTNGNGGVSVFGGTLNNASFEDGSTLTASGGAIRDVTLASNGHGFITSATVESATISGGTMVLYSGAITSNSVLTGNGTAPNGQSQAFEAISAGASSYNAILNNAAAEYVSYGGVSISATINDGSYAYAYAGGTLSDLTINNTASAIVSAGGQLTGATVNNGGYVSIENGGTLSGTLFLQSGGQASIYSNAGGTIVMDGEKNTGLVISGLSYGGIVNTVISGFNGTSSGESDGIVLDGVKDGDVVGIAYDSDDANRVWINLKNGHAIGLEIDNASSLGNSLVVGNDGNLIYEVCFLSGGMIRTPAGDVAVENLTIGHDVLTFDWKSNKQVSRPVVWVGKAHAAVRPELSDDAAGWPVRILKDAIADGVPYKDMLITSEHCLFFDGKFVPARMLVNGVSIFYDKSITSYDYYHVETEQHSVITADGMLTESYLDTGNRSSFSQEGTVVRLGGQKRTWADHAGAPLCVERSFVEPLFRALELRENCVAGCRVPMEESEITLDPDLHLVTDTGATIRSMRHKGQQYSFMLPPETKSVRLVSRASRPADVIGPFVDDRRSMGVAVADVHLLCAKQTHDITSHLQAEKPEGWHESDWTDCAWTNGNAVLPLGESLTDGKMGILSMTIRAAGPYCVQPRQVEETKVRSA
ncbi:Hint domain-containing protein [Acetobacter malorum]|uniref:Hint domain-containing protein n=2 Tax=Acetobacter malorum TaxID=178901 RepID=UPI0039E9CC1F